MPIIVILTKSIIEGQKKNFFFFSLVCILNLGYFQNVS